MSGSTVRDHGREVRETVVKSTLAGVGITVLAVTLCSQTGLGGMIGTSVASSMGGANESNDPYAKLPAFPSVLTRNEISDIRGQLASVAAAMEITRAATDDRIEHVHELAEHPGLLSLAAPRHFAKSMPVAVVSPPPAPTPVERAAPAPEPTVAPAPTPGVSAAPASLSPVSDLSGPVNQRSSHMELAALFFGDDD